MEKSHHRMIRWSIVAFIALNAVLFFIFITIQPPVPDAPQKNEVPVITQEQPTSTSPTIPFEALPTSTPEVLSKYIEVTDGCDSHFGGECLRVRSGPGTDFPTVAKLRNGMVLKVANVVEIEGRKWYQVVFDEWLRYPERITSDWFVVADYVTEIEIAEEHGTTTSEAEVSETTPKRIIVDRSEQQLRAYEGSTLFFEAPISTGLDLTPTPRGTFRVFKKLPSRYMQGPLPYLVDQQEYDLPGVPWNLYFTEQGAVIHGAYWHTNFGKQHSHGCVNLSPPNAQKLYTWADLGTEIIVRD